MADSAQIPPPWQRLPARAARRRRDPISRDAIVATAIRLLDAEGLDALSMRGIADELGTGAASLYWHVGSKDGLLDLIFDQLIGEVSVSDPDPGRWRDQVKEVARSQRAVSLRHPYVVRISIGRIPMGPNALRYSERALAILRAAEMAAGYLASLPPPQFPDLVELADEYTYSDPDERFELLIDIFTDGLARRAEAAAAGAPEAPGDEEA